jgi:hypothetical protein
MTFKRLVLWLGVALIALNVADIVTTTIFLNTPAMGLEEANPLAAAMFRRFGEGPVYLVKITVACMLAEACVRLVNRQPRLVAGPVIGLSLVCLAQAWVVRNNLELMLS